MANIGAKIIGNAISGLQAQQAQIANASNNIANVNTQGYSRRVVSLETRASSTSSGSINIGDGVSVASVMRIADSFLDTAVRTTAGEKASAEMQNNFMSRIEQLFNITGDRSSIGDSLTKFFTAFNDLAANPANIGLRANVIEASQNLASEINTTFNSLASLQKEADTRIASEINGINAITAKIADLNEKIRSREGGSGFGSAADERDQREVLLQQLSESLSYDRIDVADGTVTLSLSSGFPLVSGATSRNLEVTSSPSFAGATTPPSLWGGALSYVVFDFDTSATNSHIDLSNVIRQGQGSLGALLEMRGVASPADTNAFQAQGTIPDLARRVEALTRSLLTDFNREYLGPDRDAAALVYEASSGDLNGTVPTTFGLFDFTYAGIKDINVIGEPEIVDLDTLLNNGSVKNFSSLLTVAFSDPRRLAAARDDGPGAPAAVHFSPGDNANALAMANLQTTSIGSISMGTFTSSNITVNDFYNQMVGYVGNLKASSELAKNVSNQSLIAAQNRRDAVSAVSLDEEYSSLTIYQQAYQASARMIRVADQIFQEVLGLIG
jgi:flagellar hook-associated protein 1 FlgK